MLARNHAILCFTLALCGAARADDGVIEHARDDGKDGPQLVGDVRTMVLVRSDNNYFTHAEKFNYDFPGEAGGIQGTLGVELAHRWSMFGEGFYVLDGANRSGAQLRLSSGALLGGVKGALYRVAEQNIAGELAVTGGFGRYYIRETYVDRNLSPMVFSTTSGGFGGFGGVEASLAIAAFRVVIAYGYHYAPARIDDRVRGSVEAGGHEISFGVGVVL